MRLTLLFLLALSCHPSTSTQRKRDENVARTGMTSQSSTHRRYNALRAIDGNKNTKFGKGSCTSTRKSKSPWWTLDLRREYSVREVQITNRMDCCSERIMGAEIYIGNTQLLNRISNNLCATVQNVSNPITFRCEGFVGRYLTISLPGKNRILSICEVEVFASMVPELNYIVNLALGAWATQSSTRKSAEAYLAIDSRPSTLRKLKPCSETNPTNDPWWMIDMHGIYQVSVVRITRQEDCCSEQLQGAEIRIGNSSKDGGMSNKLCGTIQVMSVQRFTFVCEDFTGRFVSVIIPGKNKTVTLCEVEVYGEKLAPLNSEVNVALRGTASQSSTHRSGRASKAIDGDTKTDGNAGMCSQTESTKDPWWRVDLKISHIVTTIIILNREDCCSEQLLGALVHIGDSLMHNGSDNYNRLCGTVNSVVNPITFHCDGIVGRYVNIFIPGNKKTLTLCEVQVFGSKLPSLDMTVNLALDRRAIQSSTENRAVANLAIDGDTSSNMELCTKTSMEDNPWWVVDLEETSIVTFIRITNSVHSLMGAEIRIGNKENINKLCGTVRSMNGTTFTFACGGLKGRYVNIMLPGLAKILNLCEVEIYGSKPPILESAENLALKGKATMSSLHSSWYASYGNDGNINSRMQQARCTHTRKEKEPWWRLDLMENYIISSIRITNRLDRCCLKRILGAEIRIGNSLKKNGNMNSLCATIRSPEETATYNCNGLVGRYVNVMLPGSKRYLTLCEVEVFGEKLPLKKVNLALGKLATQSHAKDLVVANRAIDGNKNSNANEGSCTQSETGIDPWWMVDLKQPYFVSFVRITNRMDCCSDHLLGAEVHLGNNGPNSRLCGVVEVVTAETLAFHCGGFIGEHVRIITPGVNKSVALCEVEVFGLGNERFPWSHN